MAMPPGMNNILKEVRSFPFKRVLDIGFGDGEAAEFFIKNNKQLDVTGFNFDKYSFPEIVKEKSLMHEGVGADKMDVFTDDTFDSVWCSHVLEHTGNHQDVLSEINRVLKKDGWLFISVPEYTEKILGGHINTGWNIGSLMYNLAVANFNVREGHFVKHMRNITAFVKKRSEDLSVELTYDNGDIEALSDILPEGLNHQGFCGNINSYNWEWKYYDMTLKEKYKDRKEHLLTHLKNFSDRVLNFLYFN